jgi:hypothetical protein
MAYPRPLSSPINRAYQVASRTFSTAACSGRSASISVNRRHSFWLEAWYADIINDEYVLLFEVKGSQEFSEQHLEDLRGVLAMESDRPIQVYVRAHIEAVLGTDDNISYEELLLRLRERSEL